jgi:hypothetical protein
MTFLSTLPQITAANRGFWEAASRGVLALAHCKVCGHSWYPPSSHCPSCLSIEFEFRPASGRARLWSWTVIHRRYFNEFPPPYVVAFVNLEEGPMLMSTVVGVRPEDLRCDMPLVAMFDRMSNEIAVLKFVPSKSPR